MMKNVMRIMICVSMTLFAISCSNGNKSTEQTNETTDTIIPMTDSKSDTTTVMQQESSTTQSMPQVIDFYATWCGPCKALAPIVAKMEKKYQGKIEFKRVDIDENREMAEKYQIEAVPTMIYKNKKGKITSSVGLVTEQELDKKLRQLLAE